MRKTKEQILDELAKKKRREYMKEWRSKPENKERIKGYMQNYWKRKAEKEGVQNV